MGVVNVTPDSFSDGGRYLRVDDAIERGALLFEQGAALVDVGGESTRPGATRLDPEEERRRVLPVIAGLAERRVPVSIDTVNAATAAAAIGAGAALVNDVSGGLADPGMARVVADAEVHFVAMHWRGGASVQPEYGDVVVEVRDELLRRVDDLTAAGIAPERIILDPGLGFAKTGEHNWQILGRLEELTRPGFGVLIGASRKRFLGDVLPDGSPITDRDLPTAVISALAAASGVWAVRVHDVPGTRAALRVWDAWEQGRSR
ncbi:MAG: dihydropteroate synthase [Micrococcales bacterium]|nr:dihydropteroate synthase [Micrococcales bacterium]